MDLCQIASLFGNFPGGSEVKVSASNAGDLGSIPGSWRSPGEGNDNPLQYSCLENPMDWGAWWAAVHGVTKSRTRLSDFTYLLTYLEILDVNVHRPLQVTPENFGWSALSHGSPSVVTIRDSLPIFFSVKTSVQAKTLEEHLAIHWQVKSGSNTISVFYGKKLYSLYFMTSMI